MNVRACAVLLSPVMIRRKEKSAKYVGHPKDHDMKEDFVSRYGPLDMADAFSQYCYKSVIL